MKRCLVLACCMLLSASWVSAEIGALCLYSDAGATDCSFVDNGELVPVYIVHQYADGATASQFKLDVSGTGWTHLGDTWNYPLAIGSSVTGVSVGYGACLSSPIVVGVVNFMGASVAANTPIEIVPDPAVGEIQVVDCDGYTRIGAGGTAWVNSSTPCVCEVNTTPILDLDPGSIDFGYTDDSRPLTVLNRGGGTLQWSLYESLDWLALSATSGTNRETVTVSVVRTGLAPGVYSGAIEVSSNAGSRSVNVIMTVAPTAPILRVQPATLSFGEDDTVRQLYVYNDGAPGLDWSVSSDQSWLSVTPASGGEGVVLTVTVDRSGLSYGSYYGNLTFTSNGGNQTVTVSMIVPSTEPVLDVSPLTLDFYPDDDQKTLMVNNIGRGTLEWSVATDQPWLYASPPDGTGDANVTVFVMRGGMAPGTYFGNVTVTSNGGDAVVPVSMEIPGPDLVVTPPSLTFDPDVDVQTLYISNSGFGDLDWSISADVPWLSATPAAGTNDTEVTVTVDRTGLDTGFYIGSLSVTSNGGDTMVYVTLYVQLPTPLLSVAPLELSFGSADTERTLYVTNTGTGVLEWSITPNATWLSVNPATGTGDATVAVYVDRTGLPDGLHTSTLSVTSNGGNETVTVEVWVGPQPVLAVTPQLLSYSPADTSESFMISNAGDGTLEWSLSKNRTWIEIVPPLSGTNDATVTVNVDPAAVPSGPVQTGAVTVSSNAGTETVQVRFDRGGQGQAGTIRVFSDAAGTNNIFNDSAGGLVQVYMFHTYHDGATAAQFKLDVSETGWSHLGDLWEFTTIIGTSVIGVSIGYGGCLPAPTYLGVANFYSPGSTDCRQIRIVADPSAPSGAIEMVDCGFNKLFATGGLGYVNCDVGIPVRPTTWGRIKAMYAPKED